jgi:hypothetical protein
MHGDTRKRTWHVATVNRTFRGGSFEVLLEEGGEEKKRKIERGDTREWRRLR